MRKDAREVYEKTAGIYDRRSSNPYTMRFREMELGFLRRFARGRVLDAGCGTGFHLPYLDDVVGLEPSKGMREIAKKTGKEVIDGDVEKLPFGGGEFDSVLCMYSVLNVVDWKKAIAEMCRVCRGNVIVSVSSVYDKGYTLGEKRKLHIDEYAQVKKVHVHGVRMRMHLFTEKELVDGFGKNGFRLVGFDSLYRGANPKWGNFQGFSLRDRMQMWLDRFRDRKWGCLYLMAFRMEEKP
jgi:ubiquinone/menaquinone biosynthesis C-methylase UbiE